MSKRPNIVIIAVHDLGTRLGCYGWENVPSPRLDGLAEDGVRFENNFCTGPYCSPSKDSIITGKYPHVNGLMGLVNLGWEWHENNLNLAKALGNAGYDTHLFGFQHEASNEQVGKLGFKHVSDRSLRHNCENVAPLVEDFLAGRDAGADEPFYARIGFNEVHRPIESNEPEDPSRVSLPGHIKDTPGAREDFALFDGAIRRMDTAVGRILDGIERAGLKHNTVVVFTADHGIPFPGAKATLYDPGINTTLIMRWPGGMPSGKTYSELLSNVDLFPTLLEIAGVEIPGDIQGRSFLPLFNGGDYEAREMIFAEKNTTPIDVKRCVRTARFKYIRNYNTGPRLVLSTDIEKSLTRRDMGNDHLVPRPEIELYDLENDPHETENLAGKAEFANVEQELSVRLKNVQEITGDPILDGSLKRPPDETEIYSKARRNMAEKCPFPREGLLTGYEANDRISDFAR